jgi:hypothetical protein
MKRGLVRARCRSHGDILIRASNRFNRPLLQIRRQTRVPMCFDARLLYWVSSGLVMHMIAFFALPCVALGGCLFHHNREFRL